LITVKVIGSLVGVPDGTPPKNGEVVRGAGAGPCVDAGYCGHGLRRHGLRRRGESRDQQRQSNFHEVILSVRLEQLDVNCAGGLPWVEAVRNVVTDRIVSSLSVLRTLRATNHRWKLAV
jgi:hypothetical protein